jgi:hypothetical protein
VKTNAKGGADSQLMSHDVPNASFSAAYRISSSGSSLHIGLVRVDQNHLLTGLFSS